MIPRPPASERRRATACHRRRTPRGPPARARAVAPRAARPPGSPGQHLPLRAADSAPPARDTARRRPSHGAAASALRVPLGRAARAPPGRRPPAPRAPGRPGPRLQPRRTAAGQPRRRGAPPRATRPRPARAGAKQRRGRAWVPGKWGPAVSPPFTLLCFQLLFFILAESS